MNSLSFISLMSAPAAKGGCRGSRGKEERREVQFPRSIYLTVVAESLLSLSTVESR